MSGPVRRAAPRILCARYPHLALIAVWRRHPELCGEPVVVTVAQEGPRGAPSGTPDLRLPVVAASEPAAAAGVRPGQPLREAQQRCPAAAVLPSDGPAADALREELLALLCTLAPRAEVADHTAWCDLSGRHAAYRDEAAWAMAVARGVAGLLDGAAVSVGVAGSRLAAGIAAAHAPPRRIRRIAAGEEAAYLAPLPLSSIPVDPGIAARLAAMGLDCVGAVASLAAADLQRQFGPAGIELWHRVRGEDGVVEGRIDGPEGTWPALPAAAPPPHRASGGGPARPADERTAGPRAGMEGAGVRTGSRRLGERILLEGGVGDLEALRFAVHRAAGEIGERLRERGCRAAAVVLSCELEAAAPVGLRILPSHPPGSGAELWPVALELLAGLRLPAPVVAIRLEVEGLERGAGRQADLWRGDTATEAIEGAAARLRARFGPGAVRTAELADDPGDLPERRFRWAEPEPVAVTAPGRGDPAPARGGHRVDGRAPAPVPAIPALRR